MHDATARRLSTLHKLLYRTTRGFFGRRLVANDMLLLTTTGRNSGRPHTVPLLYLRDGSDVVVIASWGGRDYPPNWYENLVADPAVSVQINGLVRRAAATVVDEPERSAWWSRFVAAFGGYVQYQARTERVIPIVRLATMDQPEWTDNVEEESLGAP